MASPETDPIDIGSIDSLSDVSGELKAQIRKSSELNVVITGKHGAGKSALINALFHLAGDDGTYREHATEGAYQPETSRVQRYSIEYAGPSEGVKFNIFDTIGLQDGKGQDIQYLREIKAKSPRVHLFIYCIKVDDRVREDDIKALTLLTDTFGQEIWDNLVIAFTFANRIEPTNPTANGKDFFTQTLIEKASIVRDILTSRVRIQDQIVEKLKFVPAGTVRRKTLPGIEHEWLLNFWMICLSACNNDAQGTILRLHWNNPRFLRALAGSAVAASAGTVATVGGVGSIVGAVIIGVVGFEVVVPAGIALLVGGSIASVLGIGSLAGGAAAIKALWPTDDKKKEQERNE